LTPRVARQDTFLDAAHLEASFPGRSIVFTNVEPGVVPAPPFRVTFPELQTRAAEPAVASGKRKADGDAAQAPPEADAALEALRVEVRCAPGRARQRGAASVSAATQHRLCQRCRRLEMTHIAPYRVFFACGKTHCTESH
jgi:hypothetical protein